jgi:hypothetical protein
MFLGFPHQPGTSFLLPGTNQTIPPLLQLTLPQRTVKHADWIDNIPHPVWRDNLILAAGTYDKDDLCDDVVGGLWDGFPHPECAFRSVIAWSPSWDYSRWEISEGFCNKWGWSLKRCGGLLEASSRWRSLSLEGRGGACG